MESSSSSSEPSTTHSSECIEEFWEEISVVADKPKKSKKSKKRKSKPDKEKNDASKGPGLRRSLGALEIDPDDEEAIDVVSQHEETLRQPEALSRGKHFDKSIRAALGATGDLITKVLVPRQNRRGRLSREEKEKQRKKMERGRKRLKARIERSSLAEFPIRGNGNCQFSSLSDQLYRTVALSGVIRKLVVKHLRAHPDTYSPYVPSNYKRYCKRMKKSGCWGDHITLKAAADLFGVEINLLTSYRDNAILKIEPETRRTEKIVWMSFLAELHYNSLYTAKDISRREDMDELDQSDDRMKDLLEKHEEIAKDIEDGQDEHSLLLVNSRCNIM